jgi:GT2 family glycosyltransferase
MDLNYDKKLLNLFFVDNESIDKSVASLQDVKKDVGSSFNKFEILSSGSNLGFGRASNLGAFRGNSPFVFFLNIDTELTRDSLKNAVSYINNSDEKVAAWEMRQFPYESPKNYDCVSLETTWCSGAALIVKRNIFVAIKGFDKHFFMYAEDVELSWHIRSLGYKLMYMPKSVVLHHSYISKKVKPNQYIYSIIGSILLRYKYGNIFHVLSGFFWLAPIFIKKSAFKGAKVKLLKAFLMHFFSVPSLVFNNLQNRFSKSVKAVYKFKKWDYEEMRDGSFYANFLPNKQPLVSIVVRTHNRPLVLKEALSSILNQTYNNIEVLIVEDGADTSSDMIKQNFPHDRFTYYHTGEKVGRCVTGNFGLSKAKGDYLCFLDDDDLFFPDHVEVLVSNIIGTNLGAVYSNAFETSIEVLSKEPYEFKIHGCKVVHKQKFNKSLLCYRNYIPIQAILFKRELYEEYGGFDERLDVLEDWDLWLRYAQKHTFHYIDKTTSVYRVPFLKSINNKRQIALDTALPHLREKHKSYTMTNSAQELALEVEDVVEVHNPIIPTEFIIFIKEYRVAFVFYKILKKIVTFFV